MNPQYYDDVFKTTPHYQGPPEESPYYNLWKTILRDLATPLPRGRILDLGCGPGQFGELCVKAGYEYLGLDYSATAIELAEEKGYGEYKLVDLEKDRAIIKQGDYDGVTLVEFVEHVNKDREIIQAIPQGKHVTLSAPSYGDPSHVRVFKSVKEVEERYSPWVAVKTRYGFRGLNSGEKDVNVYLVRGERR